MPKLKKFNKNKNSGITLKHIVYSSFIIIGILSMFVVYKSYAIYKLEKKYDLIQSKIGTYTMGDVRVAVLVDGKETDTFPTYETNYKVESIECTNGVTATFDVENWQLNIVDMSATSTKCTVSFNSKETNEITPVNYTKTELLALNEEYQNVAYKNLKTQLVDDIYPIGSIFMTTDKENYGTADQVNEKLGGTWVRYATDTTLVGYKDGGNEVNYTDGSKTTTISYTPKGTISDYSGNSGSTVLTVEQIPPHNHVIWTNIPKSDEAGSIQSLQVTTKWYNIDYGNLVKSRDTGGGQGHTHTMNHGHTFTGTEKDIEINVQDPYTVVYMYKRTE